ncbi:MAG TPA: hypothetical protein VKI44_15450 [Acetobacteraceae bacterium]|nr:hypothetical protein [Acetobacteraceae bacterium]
MLTNKKAGPHRAGLFVRRVAINDWTLNSDLLGMVDWAEIDHDLSHFDREAFERLTWLADPIKQQWGMAPLWQGSRATNK